MRRFLTIGITGKGKIDILSTANAAKHEHIEEFNKQVAAKKKSARAGSRYAEVQVVDLSKIVKRKRFSTVDGTGKRTVARIVNKRSKSARKSAPKKSTRKTADSKRTVARTVKKPAKKTTARTARRPAKKSARKSARKPAKAKTAKAPAPTAKAAAADEGAPKLPGASEVK